MEKWLKWAAKIPPKPLPITHKSQSWDLAVFSLIFNFIKYSQIPAKSGKNIFISYIF